MQHSQDGANDFPLRIYRIMIVVLMMMACHPLATFGQATADADSSYDFQPLIGQWKVISATRDGAPVESMQRFRYFIDPGLLRWADPSKRSEKTKLPLLMGRRIMHEKGNLFEARTIFPPDSESEMELRRDGDQLILVTDKADGKSGLIVRMQKVGSESPKPPQDKMVKLAMNALQEGKNDAAYQFAQLQLINFPDDLRGATLLGVSSMRSASQQADGPDSNRLDRARSQATWAVERVPENDDLRKEFAQFLYFTREFAAASAQFSLLRERGVLTKDQLVTYAQCEVLQSRIDKAKALLEEATGYDTKTNKFTENVPEQPNSGYLTLAILLMKMGNPAQGDQIMEEMVKQFPDSSIACLHRGRYQLLNTKREEALQSFAKALELAPDDRDSLLVNIEIGLSEEDDRVDGLIERAFELFGRDPLVITLACARASIQKNYQRTLELAEEGLEITPKNMPLLGLKTQAEINLKEFAAAEASIATMPEMGFHGVSVEIMRARLLIAQEKLDDADTIINRLTQVELPQGAQSQLLAVRELLAEARRNVDGDK